MNAENVVSCPACKKPLGGEVVQMKPDPNLPPVTLHEACFLRGAAAAAEKAKTGLVQVLVGILHKLGGTVALHSSDVQQGMALGGGSVSMKQQADGTLLVFIGEEKRVVLATPGDAPRPPLRLT